jgi:hypothetical protein
MGQGFSEEISGEAQRSRGAAHSKVVQVTVLAGVELAILGWCGTPFAPSISDGPTELMPGPLLDHQSRVPR